MSKLTFILLLIIAYSCKNENNQYTMYGFLNQEFYESSEMLKVQITENLKKEKLINNKYAIEYHSLTHEYLSYLEDTSSKLIVNIETTGLGTGEINKEKYVNELFFTEGKYNEKATEFISKMEKYRTEILKLIKDKNLVKRVERILNAKDIKNRDGKKFKYLIYLYQDMPLISVIAHLKSQELAILEFENDFLKNLQINE